MTLYLSHAQLEMMHWNTFILYSTILDWEGNVAYSLSKQRVQGSRSHITAVHLVKLSLCDS